MSKQCTDCLIVKPSDDFSLARGHHSEYRKVFCKQCEIIRRKAKKHGIDHEIANSLLRGTCHVCNSDEALDLDVCPQTGSVLGVLCKDCRHILSLASIPGRSDYFDSVCCYLRMRSDFPFMLFDRVKSIKAEPNRPLLDWIERHDRRQEVAP